MSKLSIDQKSFEILDEADNTKDKLVENQIPYSEGVFNIVTSALPTIFAILFQVIIEVINVAFVGNLNDPDAVATLGLSVLTLNAFIIAPGYGILGGIDVLVATAYGNKQYYLCGVYLNRARIIQLLVTLPFMILLIFCKPLFKIMGQDPKVSEMSQLYVWISLPGMIGALQFQATKRFMMAQKVFKQITYFQIFLLFQHIITSYLFIFKFGIGYLGSALSATSTNILGFVGLSIILKCTNSVHPDSFHFLNKDSFKGLREYMVFGIPSMVMLVIEWVSFEVMGIYAGILGVYPLGAHTILSNLMTLFYMIPLGLSFATMAHIGTSLGRGEYKLARRYFYISYVISGLIAIITVFILNYFRKHIFTVYTSDEKILEIIYSSLLAISPMIFFGDLHGNMKGIFKSIGKQVEAAFYTSF